MWQTYYQEFEDVVYLSNLPVCQMDNKAGQIHRQTPGSIPFAGSGSSHKH